jgi:hypothetical protein
MHRKESRIVRPAGKGSGANPLLGCLIMAMVLACLLALLLVLVSGEDLFFWWVWLS